MRACRLACAGPPDPRPPHRRPLVGLLLLLACRPPPDLPRSPPADAVTLLSDRCDRGEAPACVEVAAAARAAGNDPRDLVYTLRACALASPRACTDLADRHDRGAGVARDRARALDLRVQACLGGFAPACRRAADDLPAAEADAFRRRACAAGDTSVCPPPPGPAPPAVDPRDQAAVTLALAARRDAVRACLEPVLVDRPRLRGHVVLQIAVGPEGLARAAVVIEGLDPRLDDCLVDLARSTAYGPTTTGDIVVVRHRTFFDARE